MNGRSSCYQVRSLLLCAVLGSLLPAALQARPDYPAQFNSTYPNSTTGNASCLVCHGTNASGNANSKANNHYGIDFRYASGNTLAQRLQSIEQLDSDGEGNKNRTEIDANAQPGWCEPRRADCNNGGFAPPSSITLQMPPPAAFPVMSLRRYGGRHHHEREPYRASRSAAVGALVWAVSGTWHHRLDRCGLVPEGLPAVSLVHSRCCPAQRPGARPDSN